MKFYYQIKGKLAPDDNSGFMGSNWSFPPIWSDIIEAYNKDDAKKKIDSEYSRIFPLRVLKKDIDSQEFLLSIKEISPDDKYFQSLTELKKCKNPSCENTFTQLSRYQVSARCITPNYCSQECYDKHNKFEMNYEDFNKSIPVIYMITCELNHKHYIGQTTRSFTLRWWEHIKSIKEDKFHKALREINIIHWSFRILEIVQQDQDINSREKYYIDKYNSIENGFNTKQ